MDIFEVISKRHSVRSFLDKNIDQETITRLFSAVRLAPSAKNTQEWRFVLVTDPKLRAIVADASKQDFVGKCPVIIVACARTDHRIMRCGEKAYPIDVAIAIDHLCLAATELGLGTCWVGSFDPEPIRAALGIPEEIPIVEIIPLGYPAAPASPSSKKQRLPISEIISENTWGKL